CESKLLKKYYIILNECTYSPENGENMKQEKKQFIKINLSIDMINAVGNLRNMPLIFLTSSTDIHRGGWIQRIENQAWQYVRVYENGDIEVLITLQILKFHKYFDTPVWIQYNPNHLLPEDYIQLDHVMKYVDHSHFTRADLAQDIFNINLQRYDFGLFGVTRDIYRSLSGELETRYWGRRKSERQIRLYDKMREMKKHGKTENIPDGITDWWRLEFQFRGGKVEKWQEEVVEKMQSFHVLTLDDNDDISEIDKAVIERVNSDKFNFKKVSKDYATKIRKMVRENVGFDTTVSEFSLKAFNEQKDELQKQLDNMLAKYNIGEQTAEMTAYFEQQLNQTSNIDLSVVESGSVLERNVVRSISKHWQESK
ncbi:replication initiation factor domain-containing protein, partial [Leuconostoc falkenbergense]